MNIHIYHYDSVKLDVILDRLEIMMAKIDDLVAQLAEINTDVDTIATEVTNLLTLITNAGNNGLDATQTQQVSDSLTALKTRLDGVATQAKVG